MIAIYIRKSLQTNSPINKEFADAEFNEIGFVWTEQSQKSIYSTI